MFSESSPRLFQNILMKVTDKERISPWVTANISNTPLSIAKPHDSKRLQISVSNWMRLINECEWLYLLNELQSNCYLNILRKSVAFYDISLPLILKHLGLCISKQPDLFTCSPETFCQLLNFNIMPTLGHCFRNKLSFKSAHLFFNLNKMSFYWFDSLIYYAIWKSTLYKPFCFIYFPIFSASPWVCGALGKFMKMGPHRCHNILTSIEPFQTWQVVS